MVTAKLLLKPESKVWAKRRLEDEDWIVGTVIEQIGERVRLKGMDDGTEFVVEGCQHILEMNPRLEEDLSNLHHLHEPGILHNLEQRSKKDHPYTFMASVLVSINPLIEKAKDHEMKIVGSPNVEKHGPHVFAVAEVAFKQMHLGNSEQSVVISGESGAGKTEAAKKVVRHLVARCSGKQMELSGLEQKLLYLSPLIERLGNAKTVRNNNSSRFGKYTKILFQKLGVNQWKVVGANIETYLLERSRVAYYGPDESNFHILHDIVGNDECVKTRGLDLVKSSLGIKESLEANSFERFGVAFKELVSQSRETWASYLDSIAAVLHLLNIDFDGDTDTSKLKDGGGSVEWVTKLLGVDNDMLEKLLCEKKMKCMNQEIVSKVGVETAINNRNALAKHLYSALFDWVIGSINSTLSPASDQQQVSIIGVLDIFGFESFQKNGFEQLLINYANEALQNTFLSQVFQAELVLYKSEGLVSAENEFSMPKQSTNVLELLHGRKNVMGLLATIDEVSKAPKPTNNKLNQMFHNKFGGKNGNSSFVEPHPKDKSTCFIVKHFPGNVKYSVEEFVEKNNDRLPNDADSFLQSSSNAIVSSAFTPTKGSVQGLPPVHRNGRRKPKAVPSIVSKYTKNIRELVNSLEATKCLFIRCVKPNVTMRRDPGQPWFDRSYVARQLRCLSITETAKVLKSGLPTRIPYKTFIETYQDMLPKEAIDTWKCLGQQNEREFVKALFWALEVPVHSYRCGNTLVFFRSGQLAMLSRILDVTTIRPDLIARFRRYYTRGLWRKCVAKIIATNAFDTLLLKLRSAKFLQKYIRGFLVRHKYLYCLDATRKLQCWIRQQHAKAILCRLRNDKKRKEQEEEEEKEATSKERLRDQSEDVELPSPLILRIPSFKSVASNVICEDDDDKDSVIEEKEGKRRVSIGSTLTMPRLSSAALLRIPSFRSNSIKVRSTRTSASSNLAGDSTEDGEVSRAESFDVCSRTAEKLFGLNPGTISDDLIEQYQQQAVGPAAWEVLGKKLLQCLRYQEKQVESTKSMFDQSEQQCWEFKVCLTESREQVMQLTQRIVDFSTKTGVLDEGSAADYQRLQLKVRNQQQEIESLMNMKECMSGIVDQLTLDLERERLQFERNYEFMQTKLRETEEKVEEYEMELAKCKTLLAQTVAKLDPPNAGKMNMMQLEIPHNNSTTTA